MAFPTVFSQALRAASEAIHLGDIADHVVARLGEAIGASAFLFGPDQAVRASQIHGQLAPLVAPYLIHYAAGDPNGAAKERSAEPILVHSRIVDPRAYHRTATYNEFFRRHDVEHFLSVRLFGAPASTGPITILYSRGRSAPDFDGKDARLLAHALPALNAAVVRAVRYEALLDERRVIASLLERADPRAQVAVDDTGRILWVSARAEALLLGRFGRRDLLPGELVAAARRLARFASTGETVEPLIHTLALRSNAIGRPPITARLGIARTALGAPFVEIELDGSAPPAARAGLTPAETRVLALLGEGISNAAIASRLFVSVETVKTHVRRVLDKLGVRSRAQAALMAKGWLPDGRD